MASTENSSAPNRRRKGLALGAGAALVAIVAAAVVVVLVTGDDRPERTGISSTLAAANRANVIWLMTDDQEEASMRVMPKTRRLIGDHGVTFANSISAWPLCCPTRATLQTGQYAHNHGVLENRPPLGGYHRLDAGNTLPIWLQEAGYETVQVGKYINDYKKTDDVPPGWTEWYGLTEPADRYFKAQLNENGKIVKYGKDERDYSTDLFTRKATDYITNHSANSDKPFFLSLGYVAPHVGKAFVAEGRCGDNGPEPAPRDANAFQGVQIPRKPSFNEADVSDKPAPIRELPKLTGTLLHDKTDRYQCRLASLLAVDDSVAAIVRALRESGQLENTYIFFTSDNGYVQGEHRLEGGKSVLYEESLRVPLLVRGPDIPRGETSRSPVSSVDWAPTILEIAGAEPGLPQDGTSMLPAAEHPSHEAGRALLIESARERYSGVRTDRYVYAEYYGGGTYDEDDVEMYDLAKDPYELENLRDDPEYEDVRNQLAGLLDGLRECEGQECDATADLSLMVERQDDVPGTKTCRSTRALATVAGPDADRVSAARFSVAGKPVGRGGASPAEIEVPGGQRAGVRARVELTDGRVADLDASLPGCGRK